MVDALEAVRTALRPRGVVFDLQPDAQHLPEVAVRDRRGRRPIGVLLRQPDEDVIAAHEVRDRVVREGRFVEIASLRRTYRTRYTRLAAFEADKRSHTPPWRLAPGGRSRLVRAWRARGDGATVEVTRRMTVAVLEKTAQPPR